MFKRYVHNGTVYTANDADLMSVGEFFEMCGKIIWRRGGVIGAETMQNMERLNIVMALQHCVVHPTLPEYRDVGKTLCSMVHDVAHEYAEHDSDVVNLKAAIGKHAKSHTRLESIVSFVAMHVQLLAALRGDLRLIRSTYPQIRQSLWGTHYGGNLIKDIPWAAFEAMFRVHATPALYCERWEFREHDGSLVPLKGGHVCIMSVHYTKLVDAQSLCGLFACALGDTVHADMVQLMFEEFAAFFWDCLTATTECVADD